MALHERSPRASHPFVTLDCREHDSETLEVALFGRPMKEPVESSAVRRAEGGTLFIAAIDELPLLIQPGLLRFLDQERNVRIVASSDRDLLTCVERGHFRLDLAERLTLVELSLR
jgi:DNA-binding NtrC family response regulator